MRDYATCNHSVRSAAPGAPRTDGVAEQGATPTPTLPLTLTLTLTLTLALALALALAHRFLRYGVDMRRVVK